VREPLKILLVVRLLLLLIEVLLESCRYNEYNENLLLVLERTIDEVDPRMDFLLEDLDSLFWILTGLFKTKQTVSLTFSFWNSYSIVIGLQ